MFASRRICDALVVPEEHAEPNEAAIPLRSRLIKRDWPSMFGKPIAKTPGSLSLICNT